MPLRTIVFKVAAAAHLLSVESSTATTASYTDPAALMGLILSRPASPMLELSTFLPTSGEEEIPAVEAEINTSFAAGDGE